jgi:hypothetical protein
MTSKTTINLAYGDIDVIVNDNLKEDSVFFAKEELTNYITQMQISALIHSMLSPKLSTNDNKGIELSAESPKQNLTIKEIKP